ncbi:MAG: serine/threonine-protein kinase [Elusimicrobiota bacterium]
MKFRFLPLLLALLTAPSQAQPPPGGIRRHIQEMKFEMQRLRLDVEPRVEQLARLQERYAELGALERAAREREEIRRDIALRMERYTQGLLRLNNIQEEFARRQRRLFPEHEFIKSADLFRGFVMGRLAEDEERFHAALRRAEASERRRGILIVLGAIAVILLILGLAAALVYQTRRVQTTRPASLVTPPSPAVTTPGFAPALAAPALAALAGPSAVDTLRTGDLLDGSFRIERELGRGGMGIVYEAVDVTLRRKTAIKQMHKEISQQPHELELFLTEARLVASLKHPNLVEIYSILRHAGQVYLVFEHIDGQPLSRYLEGGRRLALKGAKQTVRQIAAALDYAHSKKIIHRDLKPANIMVGSDGVAKVMDFGIAHQAKMTVAKVTRANPWGTPAYMAPEQELGTVSRESDLFALGVCLYQFLTGRLPYSGPNFLAQKQQALYPPATRVMPALPQEADRILGRALDPEPANRYHSGAEFAADVAQLPDEEPPT